VTVRAELSIVEVTALLSMEVAGLSDTLGIMGIPESAGIVGESKESPRSSSCKITLYEFYLELMVEV